MVSGAGKQNSQRVNMAGWRRVRVFICLIPACSIITRIKGKHEDGQRAAFWATAGEQKKWVALFSVFFSFYKFSLFVTLSGKDDTIAVTIGACQ